MFQTVAATLVLAAFIRVAQSSDAETRACRRQTDHARTLIERTGGVAAEAAAELMERRCAACGRCVTATPAPA